jgi:hypothetical protein
MTVSHEALGQRIYQVREQLVCEPRELSWLSDDELAKQIDREAVDVFATTQLVRRAK